MIEQLQQSDDMIEQLQQSVSDLKNRIMLLEERLQEILSEPEEAELELTGTRDTEGIMRSYSFFAMIVLFFMIFTTTDVNVLFVVFLLFMLFVPKYEISPLKRK